MGNVQSYIDGLTQHTHQRGLLDRSPAPTGPAAATTKFAHNYGNNVRSSMQAASCCVVVVRNLQQYNKHKTPGK